MNYFYDILPCELQDIIMHIAMKDYIKQIYTPWTFWDIINVNIHEEYRHIQSKKGKLWYFDSIIYKNENGGVCCLKTKTKIYEKCIVIDEIRFVKNCKLFHLQHKFNKNINDIECDVYTGNYWTSGYESPLDDHLILSNESYDDAFDKSSLYNEAIVL